jgi:hypothetical protein
VAAYDLPVRLHQSYRVMPLAHPIAAATIAASGEHRNHDLSKRQYTQDQSDRVAMVVFASRQGNPMVSLHVSIRQV